jgi:type VI secretion system secreted protein Hcp
MAKNIDMYLKLDGVKGESQDSKHKDSIEIESFSWGVTNAGTASSGSGLGAGKAVFRDFTITKGADAASPVLFEKCATGEHIKSAILTIRKSGGTKLEYYKVKFTDLLVSDFSITGTGENSIPVETVTLNYTEINLHYTAQQQDGSGGAVSKGGFNQKHGTKV